MFLSLGASLLVYIKYLGRFILFVFCSLFGKDKNSNKFNLLIKQIYNICVLSFIIIFFAGIFIGMVLSLQGYSVLKIYSSEQSLGQFVSLSLWRELAPVVTALLFTGRVGSFLTSEIGNMSYSEQISSLEVIGVDPLKYISKPRILACFLSLPFLTFLFTFIAIYSSSIISIYFLGIDYGSFWGNIQNNISFDLDIMVCFVKSIIFSFIISTIAVFSGFDCKPTSDGISLAVTKTIVYSSLFVLFLDFFITALVFQG